ncbi:MAG TPA: alpha/beta hydrolase [Verrucomicrobiae bacterium]
MPNPILFITNRAIKGSLQSEPGRKIELDLDDNSAQHYVYFCRREGKNNYVEVTSRPFLAELKKSSVEQILIFIHGYSNLPEPDIFPRTEKLQALCDLNAPGKVLVVPLIWPCDNDRGIVKDYWDDEKAADASAFAFARVLQKFLAWRSEKKQLDVPCLKRINVLAHSMGNRVLRQTLKTWADYDLAGDLPLLFRNVFLVAADIVNESLEYGQAGKFICDSARNVSVYFASDDLALRASKVANLKTEASRRLGHSGPENLAKVPKNVYAIDCDDLNTRYDNPKGHSYFLYSEDGVTPGLVFQHIWQAIHTGRVDADPITRTRVLKA